MGLTTSYNAFDGKYSSHSKFVAFLVTKGIDLSAFLELYKEQEPTDLSCFISADNVKVLLAELEKIKDIKDEFMIRKIQQAISGLRAASSKNDSIDFNF